MAVSVLQTMSNMKTDMQIKVNSTKSPSNSNVSNGKFGQVFDNIMSAKDSKVSSLKDTSVENTDQTVEEVLASADLSELFEALGFDFSEATQTVQVDGEEVAVDQMLNTETLLSILNIDPNEFESILQNLSDGNLNLEDVNVEDIWSIINQAPNILEQIVTSLNSQGNVSEQDAKSVLQFLKLTQLVGEKTDTIYQQQYALTTLKEALVNVTVQISPALGPMQNITQTSTTTIFQQVMLGEQKVESNITASNNSGQEGLMQQNQQSQQGVRTVNVTLPTNPASQSEALAKQIENLLNRSQVSNSQGTIKLMLKLFPENLGQIRIELVQQNGVMTARLLASTSAGKELLDSSLNQLKSALVGQNIQMDRIDIAQSLQETDRNSREQNLFGNLFQKNSQEEENESDENTEEDQKSFNEFLIEEVQQ